MSKEIHTGQIMDVAKYMRDHGLQAIPGSLRWVPDPEHPRDRQRDKLVFTVEAESVDPDAYELTDNDFIIASLAAAAGDGQRE